MAQNISIDFLVAELDRPFKEGQSLFRNTEWGFEKWSSKATSAQIFQLVFCIRS